MQNLLTAIQETYPSPLPTLLEASFPTTSDEDWKYTSLKKFLSFEVSPTSVTALPQELAQLIKSCHTLHYANGGLQTPQNEIPTQLKTLINKRELRPQSQGLELLSYMAQDQRLVISIEKNLDRPVLIIHQASQTLSGLQLEINVSPQVQVDFMVLSLSPDGAFIDSQNISVKLEQNSRLNLMDVMLNQSQTRRLSIRSASLKKDAHLHQLSLILGGAMTRVDADVHINGLGGHATVNAMSILKNQEHADFFSTIEHEKEHTTSHQLVKQVLAHQSRGVFTGKVHIHPQAQHVSAQQLNKNLVLGEKAQVNTRPQLEVQADDVKCSHGATIGQLSADELFYLQSRGFDLLSAKRMLSHAFVQEVIEMFPNPILRQGVAQLIVNNLSELQVEMQ